MAEFQEVMRQAKRMCAEFGNDCAGCGLADSHCPLGPIPENWDGVNFAKVERIVMDWAERNPEPRYPTWTEWQRTNFPNSNRGVCTRNFAGKEVCDLYDTCEECLRQPIPADIAEKLGIKPMGGTDDADYQL